MCNDPMYVCPLNHQCQKVIHFLSIQLTFIESMRSTGLFLSIQSWCARHTAQIIGSYQTHHKVSMHCCRQGDVFVDLECIADMVPNKQADPPHTCHEGTSTTTSAALLLQRCFAPLLVIKIIKSAFSCTWCRSRKSFGPNSWRPPTRSISKNRGHGPMSTETIAIAAARAPVAIIEERLAKPRAQTRSQPNEKRQVATVATTATAPTANKRSSRAHAAKRVHQLRQVTSLLPKYPSQAYLRVPIKVHKSPIVVAH